ncbi:hypothetical protein R5R35_007203 [Gryllus longicercus]|uniref:Uncharacterized protein n=1 Tax=Gryllus longicercus TaxID=2509291 RepID=A0AAN9VV25_9ORTH
MRQLRASNNLPSSHNSHTPVVSYSLPPSPYSSPTQRCADRPAGEKKREEKKKSTRACSARDHNNNKNNSTSLTSCPRQVEGRRGGHADGGVEVRGAAPGRGDGRGEKLENVMRVQVK